MSKNCSEACRSYFEQSPAQVPATEQYQVSSTVNLAAGESIVVAIPRVFSDEPGADAETTTIVALTPRIIILLDSAKAYDPSQ